MKISDSSRQPASALTDQQINAAQRLHQEVIVRSATDQEFRQFLVSDPRAAVNSHLKEVHGTRIGEWNDDPERIASICETAFVRPSQADSSDALTDDQLETVAGGAIGLPEFYEAAKAAAGAIASGIAKITEALADSQT